MNEKLKSECEKNNIPFFDIFDIVSDNGRVDRKLCTASDTTHLDRNNEELRNVIEGKLFNIINNFYS